LDRKKIKEMKSLLVLFFLIVLGACATDSDQLVTIHTKFGDIKLVLHDATPLHKKNFLKLAKSGAFDSTYWHRVIRNFMVQGGDVTQISRPEPELIPAEFNPQFIHERGAVAAARRGDNVNPNKESSGSQFYIVQGQKFRAEQFERLKEDHILNQIQPHFMPLLDRQSNATIKEEYKQLYDSQNFEGLRQLILQNRKLVEDEFGKAEEFNLTERQMEVYTTIGGAPHLDGSYTVFGMVLEGMEAVDKIAGLPTGQGGMPKEKIFMTVEVEKMSRTEISEKYGYSYPAIRE